MATTRRPQINHRLCGHAATPAARRACRTAQRAEQAVAMAATLAEFGHLVGEQVLFYGVDEQGNLDELRHYGLVTAVAVENGWSVLVVLDMETHAEVTVDPHATEHVPTTHEKYREDLV